MKVLCQEDYSIQVDETEINITKGEILEVKEVKLNDEIKEMLFYEGEELITTSNEDFEKYFRPIKMKDKIKNKLETDLVLTYTEGMQILLENPKEILDVWKRQALIGFAQFIKGIGQLSYNQLEDIKERYAKKEDLKKELDKGNITEKEFKEECLKLPPPVFYVDKKGNISMDYKPYGKDEFQVANYTFAQPPEYKQKFVANSINREELIESIKKDKQINFNQMTEAQMNEKIIMGENIDTSPLTVNYITDKHSDTDLIDLYVQAKVNYNIINSFKKIGKDIADEEVPKIAERPIGQMQKYMLKEALYQHMGIPSVLQNKENEKLKNTFQNVNNYIEQRLGVKAGIKENDFDTPQEYQKALEKMKSENPKEYAKKYIAYMSNIIAPLQAQKEYFNRRIPQMQKQLEKRKTSKTKKKIAF